MVITAISSAAFYDKFEAAELYVSILVYRSSSNEMN